MVEVEEQTILTHAMDSYDVKSIIDDILHTVDTHEAVKDIPLNLINTTPM